MAILARWLPGCKVFAGRPYQGSLGWKSGGGPGWLAADLTGVQATEHWQAFAAGYTAEHPLPDLSVIPWLEVCQLIGNLCFHLVEKPQYRGLESLAEGWADRALARVGELSARLL